MKCSAVKNKWCGAILKVADFGNPEAVGLAVSMVIDVQSGDRGHGLRLGFNRAQAKELGGKMVWLNFCPFCGSNISKRTYRTKK